MSPRSNALAIVMVAVSLHPSALAAQPSPGPLTIWSTKPAPEWNQAYPVGNGRLGAMVFGTVNRERIQLNEESLWAGSPRDADNPEALAALPEARRLLFAGMPVEAYALAEKKMMGQPSRLQSYQTLADLRLAFDLAWRAGRATAATLRPSVSGTHRLRAADGQRGAAITSGNVDVRFEVEDDLAVVTLAAGHVYTVSFRY